MTRLAAVRKPVTLPDGRTVYGKPPGYSGGALEEHRLRDMLARQIGGITEACLDYGRADVMTAATVFEVEPHGSWRHGVRQALGYSAQCGLSPAIALFGTIHRDDLVKLYIKLRDSKPQIALWWFDGLQWQHIGSRSACRNLPLVDIRWADGTSGGRSTDSPVDDN